MAINYEYDPVVDGVTDANGDYVNPMQEGIKQACDGVDALSNMVTDEYIQKVYSVGDYCIHDNVLYRCIVAITVPEEWTASHWTVTTIDAEIKSLNNNLTNTNAEINPLKTSIIDLNNKFQTVTLANPQLDVNNLGIVNSVTFYLMRGNPIDGELSTQGLLIAYRTTSLLYGCDFYLNQNGMHFRTLVYGTWSSWSTK